MYCPSALVQACQHGRLKNVKWLIERGAEPNSQTLASAVGHDHLELVQYLVAQEAERDLFSEQEISSAFLHAATKKNTKAINYDRNLKIIELLLAHGADRNYRPTSGQCKDRTALDFLKEQRAHALERIKLNRYGESQQAWEKKWLKHRDAIIKLLENVD
jgi:hypothetical protein